MGINCLSPLCSIFEALLSGRSTMEILQREMEELRGLRKETAKAVETGRSVLLTTLTNRSRRWLEEVDALDADVNNSLQQSSTSGGLGYLLLLVQLGDMLHGVRRLKSRRPSFTCFLTVKGCVGRESTAASSAAGTGGRRSGINLDAGTTEEVGEDTRPSPCEEALSKIRRHLLKDDGDEARIIGIFGMAGTGKTTILRRIREEFQIKGEHRGRFNKVIYVAVSRHDTLLRLQQDLCATLGLLQQSTSISSSVEDQKKRAEELRAFLSKRRFLLLLDNVREKLDLGSVGVPTPSASTGLDPNNSRSRIVFAARSSGICAAMGAEATVKLEMLDEKESWELFQKQVGADTAILLNDPSARTLAEQIVERCGGRPLALVAVGRAMADQRLPVEWENAAQALENLANQKKKGMRNNDKALFPPLKFSYDCLRDDQLRSCFLYCSMFPEGHDIDKEQLIEYWIGEGLLDHGDHASLYVARNRGHMIVRSLQSACLLQSGSRDEERFVKLHEAVRDMALWIASGKSHGETRFKVDAGRGLAKVSSESIQQWGAATRVSLMQNKIKSLPDKLPICSKLLTLWVNDCSPQEMASPPMKGRCQIISDPTGSISTFLPQAFFEFFPTLRVLDLSRSVLDSLPSSISSLCELRYLNLSYTSISSLPEELGKLKMLRQLDLRYTDQLSEIPAGTISSMKALQMLNLYGSACLKPNLTDLYSLENVTELGVSLGDLRLLGKLEQKRTLQKSVRFVKLLRMNGLIVDHLNATFSFWSRLRELRVEECNQLEEFVVSSDQLLFLQVLQLEHLEGLSTIDFGLGDGGKHSSPALPRLSYLGISHCDKLKHLKWAGHLPCLSEVHVHYCRAMDQLLMGDVSDEECPSNKNSAPKLTRLSLRGLGSLSISGIPQLKLYPEEAVEIEDCPMLTRPQIRQQC